MPTTYLPYGAQKSAGHVEEPRPIDGPLAVKPIALYLPQFHPIPANDANWGEGFTEWRNVARGQAEFTDHYQPRIPANYGFYDLRLPSVQVRQARDAKAAGIAAFAYYYYWFDGETPLLTPLSNHKDNPDIDLPFCLCFANENWTKRWDGLDDELIYKQTYGTKFAARFWNDVEPFLKSEKYLKDSQGRPILLVYRPSIIPRFQTVASAWRKLAKEAGFPGIHLVGCLSFESLSSLTKGLDSYYEFPPLNTYARSFFGPLSPKSVVHGQYLHSRTHVHDYRQFVMMERLLRSSPSNIHPAVMPGWDNVARRPFAGNAFSDVQPAVFEEWTALAARRAQATEEKLLFVNAWNEWAEGAYLEPDVRYGWASLDAFSRGLEASAKKTADETEKPVAIFVHAHYPEVWAEICSLIEERVQVPFHLVLTTSSDADLPKPSSDWLRGFEIHRVANRGRDILPFLTVLEKTKLDFDIGLKLHTKRSPHRIDGATWRQMLLGDLLPPGGCKSFVSLFREDPNIGFIGPEDHWARIGEHIGSNINVLFNISVRLKHDFSHRDLSTGRFIAGSMFWFRRQALRGLSLATVEDMFPDEAGQVDGTAAHAFERLFSLIGERNAYVTVATNQVAGLLQGLRGDDYPLNERMRMFSDQMHVVHEASGRIALSRVDNPVPAPTEISAPSAPARSPMPETSHRSRIHRFAAGNKYAVAIYRRLPFGAKIRLRRLLGLPT